MAQAQVHHSITRIRVNQQRAIEVGMWSSAGELGCAEARLWPALQELRADVEVSKPKVKP